LGKLKVAYRAGRRGIGGVTEKIRELFVLPRTKKVIYYVISLVLESRHLNSSRAVFWSNSMNRCGAKKIDLTRLLRLAAALSVAPVAASAPALEPDQVLVVYNSLDEDSEAIQKYYREARPGVAGLDLRNREILGRHTISYPTFRRAIRQPIRDFLRKEPGRAVSFVCIVLTKGIPHRLDDMNNRGIGDNPEQEKVEWLAKGDLTAASVDSELTLLWQNLEQFEEGRPFDSRADGFIVNPFYGQIKPFAEFDRRFVASPKRFIDISQSPIWIATENPVVE